MAALEHQRRCSATRRTSPGSPASGCTTSCRARRRTSSSTPHDRRPRRRRAGPVVGRPSTRAPPGSRSCGAASRRPTSRAGDRRRRPARRRDRAGGRRSARPRAAGDDRRRAPLPVRAARRRRDPPAAGRRLALPHALLPDLPAAPSAIGTLESEGLDARDDRAAGRRPGPARAVRAAAARLRGPARRPRGARGRAGAGRHAGPGQVPARARRAQPGRRPGRQPVRRRGARAARPTGPPAGPASTPTTRTRWSASGPARDPRRRRRLRHELAPPARRRPRRPGGQDRRAPRMQVVRLGQGVDRTGRLARRRCAAPGPPCADYAADLPRARRRGGPAWSRPARPATRPTATTSWRSSATTLGVDPEVVTGEEEAALSFDGATRGLARPTAPYLVVDIGGGSTELVLGSRDGARPRCRSTSAACGSPSGTWPATRRPPSRSRPPGPTSSRPGRGAGRSCPPSRPAPRSASPARSPPWPRSPSGCRRTTPTASTCRGCRRRAGAGRHRAAARP